MPRQTRQDVDREIVDRAAALFARHGFAQTSLQQVADAVGYSKAGLLHHFPSKKALFDAVMAESHRQMTQLRTRAAESPAGRERDLAVVECTVDLVVEWPGIALLEQSMTLGWADEPPSDDQPAGVIGALGVTREATDPARLVDVLSAFMGLTAAALMLAGIDRPAAWREHIVASAMRTLGHDLHAS